MMAAVHGAHTQPELFVRKRLFAAGYRFRLHPRLPGKPDIVLPAFRTAVFANGCFWHGHLCRRGQRPRTNRDFWNRKIDGNIRRDRESLRALRALGWRCAVIWQCQLERGTERLLRRLGETEVRPVRPRKTTAGSIERTRYRQ